MPTNCLELFLVQNKSWINNEFLDEVEKLNHESIHEMKNYPIKVSDDLSFFPLHLPFGAMNTGRSMCDVII